MGDSISYSSAIKKNWSEYFSVLGNKKTFAFSLIYLILVLIILPNFLQYIESRPGVILNDPILALFNPVDVTWLAFVLIYLSLILAVIHLLKYPGILQVALLTYALLVTFRIAAMYSLPLNPPESIILLYDPFVQLFGSGEILTKDLFFSGHTATLFMLFLVVKNKSYKLAFLASTFIVAVCVLLQHVHYTIDVVAAPFFTYTAYKIASVIRIINT